MHYEFEEPACCGVKHSTPCGAAIGKDIHEAYVKAYECDPVSIFGGIVALNKEVDKATAEELVKIFLEIVIAPSFTEEALEVLRTKKNLRVIKCHHKPMDKVNRLIKNACKSRIAISPADSPIRGWFEYKLPGLHQVLPSAC